MKQDKFTPIGPESFYWMLYSQFSGRSELGIQHQQLKSPYQMQNQGCDRFWKLYLEKHPVIINMIEEMKSKGEITDVVSFFQEQQQGKKPVALPIIASIANLMEIDILIIEPKKKEKSFWRINGSLTSESDSNKPPIITGRLNDQFQSLLPLDGAGKNY